MRKIEPLSDKFCGTHGLIKGGHIQCPLCNQALNMTAPYTIIRKCDSCEEEVDATPSYFESVLCKCPACEDGKLQVIHTQHSAPNFVLDGSWNGKDRSKVIKEKNEQLKRRNAGYSHEQQSIKEKTTKALQEKGIL
jgi:hypothetical protein